MVIDQKQQSAGLQALMGLSEDDRPIMHISVSAGQLGTLEGFIFRNFCRLISDTANYELKFKIDSIENDTKYVVSFFPEKAEPKPEIEETLSAEDEKELYRQILGYNSNEQDEKTKTQA